MAYKLKDNGVLKDGAFTPPDEGNRDWQDYLAFVQAGGVAAPADEPDPEEIAREVAAQEAPITAKVWFSDNPSARLLFSLSIPDLQTEINNLVDALHPTATAGNRTRLKLLLMALAICVRILVKRERLD